MDFKELKYFKRNHARVGILKTSQILKILFDLVDCLDYKK
jgi:hypothetical protein